MINHQNKHQNHVANITKFLNFVWDFVWPIMKLELEVYGDKDRMLAPSTNSSSRNAFKVWVHLCHNNVVDRMTGANLFTTTEHNKH